MWLSGWDVCLASVVHVKNMILTVEEEPQLQRVAADRCSLFLDDCFNNVVE